MAAPMSANTTTKASYLLGAQKSFPDWSNLLDTTNLSALLSDDHFLERNLHPRTHGDHFEIAVEYVSICLIPLIVFLGVIGNATCFIVFTSTYMRFKSSSTYLATLAISDGIFLVCVFVVWLARVNVLLFRFPFICKVVVYLMYMLCFSSSWIVVAFTTERYILVYHPLVKDRYCTRRGAILVCSVIVVIGALGYALTFWTNGVNYINDVPVCMPLPEYYDVITVVTGVDMTLTFVIPVIIIMILNIKILIKLHRMKSIGDYMTPWSTDSTEYAGTPRRRAYYRTSISRSGSMHVTFCSKTLDALITEEGNPQMTLGQDYGLQCLRKGFVQRRTARLVLFASTVFILLNMPSYVVRLKSFAREVIFTDTEPSKLEIQWRKLFQVCYFLNFAVDFAVYSACSGTFRAAFKRLISRYRKKDMKACNTDSG